MWEVLNPLDMDGTTTTFLFAHGFETLEQMNNQDNSIYNTFKFEGMSKAQTDETMSQHFGRITNDWSIIVAGLDGFGGEAISNAEQVISTLNYMKVDWRHGKDYVDFERNNAKKYHQDNGVLIGWALGKVLNYNGDDFPFNYVTADHYDSYAKLLKNRVNSSNMRDMDAPVRAFFKYRTLTNSHIIRLVASTQ